MSARLYIAVMVVAASVSLARFFFIAFILDPAPFGTYATIIASGAFASGLLSFGEVERTFKAFPRLWVLSRGREAIAETERAGWVLLQRVLFLLPVAVLLCYAFDIDLELGICVVGVAFGMSVASLFASLQRSTTDASALSISTLKRSVLSIMFSIWGAMALGWTGAILGEIIASGLGVLVNRRSVMMLLQRVPLENKFDASLDSNATANNDNGNWVFWGFLGASVPAYLDRSFITVTFGATVVATYAFLLLFVAAANTFVGILAQKVGPVLIQMERSGCKPSEQILYIMRWTCLFWLLWFVGMVVLAMALVWGPFVYFNEKYQISVYMLPSVVALGCLQITVILDFLLLSHDRENFLFVASCAYLLAAVVAGALTYWLGLSVIGFIWLMALAKLVHVGTQIGLIWLVVASHANIKDQN